MVQPPPPVPSLPYEVREREWPKSWKREDLKRPWALYHDGKPIGFYETKEEAEAAMPPRELW